jgi:hypothetical protein
VRADYPQHSELLHEREVDFNDGEEPLSLKGKSEDKACHLLYHKALYDPIFLSWISSIYSVLNK